MLSRANMSGPVLREQLFSRVASWIKGDNVRCTGLFSPFTVVLALIYGSLAGIDGRCDMHRLERKHLCTYAAAPNLRRLPILLNRQSDFHLATKVSIS